ncbi:MAG: hypothetical protein IJX72_05635 [Clostridia bacterium]|nr:hypothetical protein [Clostridia bacterium]
MKKIISIVLLIAMVAMSACMFASCEALTAASAIEQADKALTEVPYTVTMSMDFECDDATLNQVFDAMSMEIPVTVDGDNMYMSMSMDIMEGMSASVNMTVADKVLYYDMSLFGQNTKMKTTLNEEQYKEFTEENGSEMPIDSANFETLTLETVDGKQVITCTGITNEGLTAMNDLLAESLTSMGAEAAVGDLSFVLTIADGKYESMALTASYSVTVEGQTYNVAMTMNAKYTYENVQPITAPADADKYTEVSYDDILGE